MAIITIRPNQKPTAIANDVSPLHQMFIEPPQGVRFSLSVDGLIFEVAKGHEKIVEDWIISFADGIALAMKETQEKPKEATTREELRAKQATEIAEELQAKQVESTIESRVDEAEKVERKSHKK
jgi:hypothetical protein